jgi:hypothetical protein
MIRRGLLSALVVVFSVGAVPAVAQFMAADLIYLPAVTHTNGVGESRWRSDLFITNTEESASIDIAIVYIPTGLVSRTNYFVDRSTWLGGRESDGFGFIDPQLAGIPPGGTVVIPDPVGEHWATDQTTANSGAMVVFAYEANSLEEDGTRVFRNALVNSRVYTPLTFFVEDSENEGEFLQRSGSFGQTLPGVAWYNLADPSAIGENGDFNFQIVTGGYENEDMRFNLGIVNASDPLTSITIVLQPFRGDGEPFLDVDGNQISRIVEMPPASHVQYNSVFSLFNFASVPEDTLLRVSVLRWSSGGSEPVVGMTVYGTLIDNVTQDPTAVLPLFAHPYNVDCQWPPGEAKSSAGSYPTLSRRPVEIPPR